MLQLIVFRAIAAQNVLDHPDIVHDYLVDIEINTGKAFRLTEAIRG